MTPRSYGRWVVIALVLMFAAPFFPKYFTVFFFCFGLGIAVRCAWARGGW